MCRAAACALKFPNEPPRQMRVSFNSVTSEEGPMMDDRRDMDYRRDVDGLGYPPPPGMRDDASMTVPAIIIAAILIIGGYFVVTYSSDNVRTAANNTPAVERSTSAPTPRAPITAAPAPATTPPSAPAPAQ
jgi:hypothetical protein